MLSPSFTLYFLREARTSPFCLSSFRLNTSGAANVNIFDDVMTSAIKGFIMKSAIQHAINKKQLKTTSMPRMWYSSTITRILLLKRDKYSAFARVINLAGDSFKSFTVSVSLKFSVKRQEYFTVAIFLSNSNSNSTAIIIP